MLEINASDDRNAATVSTRIKNAIDAGSGLGDAGKPTCVVVDEIDGATGGDQVSGLPSEDGFVTTAHMGRASSRA